MSCGKGGEKTLHIWGPCLHRRQKPAHYLDRIAKDTQGVTAFYRRMGRDKLSLLQQWKIYQLVREFLPQGKTSSTVHALSRSMHILEAVHKQGGRDDKAA